MPARHPLRRGVARLGRAILRPARRLGRRGVAAVEFAFCAPFLVLLTLGGVDLLTALRAQFRLETAAVQLGQIVSQCIRVNQPGDTNTFFTHGQLMVGSLGKVTGTMVEVPPPRGTIVITAVRSTVVSGSRVNRVAWQIRNGSTAFASTVTPTLIGGATANSGDSATIANSFVVPAEQTLIVTEIFLSRDALLLRGGFVLPPNLRANTLFLSRAPDAVAMQTLVTGNSNANCTA